MGDHSAQLTRWLCFAAVTIGLILSGVEAHTEGKLMSNEAEAYIRAFQRGEGFDSPPLSIITDGRPSAAAVERLRLELTRADGPVREAIVDLLVDLGIQTDPVVHQGAAVLREPGLVAILVNEGCHTNDQGCLSALDALRVHSPESVLQPHRTRIAEIAAREPSSAALLAAAKAKALEARPTAEAEAGREAGAIALAALGDDAREQALLDAIDAAEVGEALAAALADAALAGTQRLIRKIAEQMHTPLVIDTPGVHIASVRLNVLDALCYNFPEVPEFYSNNIVDDSDYLKAEEILMKRFGVKFTKPRPEFMKLIGYPRFDSLE